MSTAAVAGARTKLFTPTVEKADGRARTFVVSTDEVDRDGDRILGWDLTQYRRNPVVLWGHDHRAPPIARTRSIRAGDGRLVATADFPPEGSYDLSDTVLRLLDARVLSAASIGFTPIEQPVRNQTGGLDFPLVELLEWSIVSVPANPAALVMRAKDAGVDAGGLVDWRHGDGALAAWLDAIDRDVEAETDRLAVAAVEAWAAGVTEDAALGQAVEDVVEAELEEGLRRGMMALTGRLD